MIRLSRLWRRDTHSPASAAGKSAFPNDHDLLAFFTNVDDIVERFRSDLALNDRRRLTVIHGVGGIGKSSVLAKFRAVAGGANAPVAFSSGETATTPIEVLREFDRTLRRSGVRCRSLAKALKKYGELEAKVNKEKNKFQNTLRTGGLAAGLALGGNPLLGAGLGQTAAEGLDLLRSVLSRPDIDLYTDPSRFLTNAFARDLRKITATRRCILMFDTYERMGGVDHWVPDLIAETDAQVLVVIAGRDTPRWDRRWPGWMAEANVDELKPMSADNMRLLVKRYYTTIRGGEPPESEVDAIVRFARGLPLVVTTAVTMWVKYNVTTFDRVLPQVIADLVLRPA